MLRLAYEIGRNDLGVGIPVSQDQTVCRAGDHVDADATEENTLGLGHKLITWAHKDVGFRQTEKAISHRGHTLNTTHCYDLVGAAKLGGIDDRGRNAGFGMGR